MAVGHRNQAEVLLTNGLAAGGELRDSATRSGLGALAARVGINFGIEDKDINVTAASQYVIEAAIANVVSPAVATHYPHALSLQLVSKTQKKLRFCGIDFRQFRF